VLSDSFKRLKIGDRVTYAEERGAKGPQASTVKLQGKHRLR
jgi:cold shock CspA family protein